MVDFLVEALTEAFESECARRVSLLRQMDENALGHRLHQIQEPLQTLSARRILALAVQVIKRRRTVRDLLTLRQTLIYGR